MDAWSGKTQHFLINEFDTCIKFTFRYNKESIASLDIKVSLKVN